MLNTFGWNGKSQYQKDRESGLMLLGHRYYDQSTGRFLSEDPVGDGANWFAYCANNPLMAVDPSGRVPVIAAVVVVAVVAVASASYTTYDYYHGTEPLTKAQKKELEQMKKNLLEAAKKAGYKDAANTINKLTVNRRYKRGQPDGVDSSSTTARYLGMPKTVIRADFFDETSRKNEAGRYNTLLHEATHAAGKYSKWQEESAINWSWNKYEFLSPFIP